MRRLTRTVLTSALFASLFAGCGLAAAPPAFVVALPENDFGSFELWVYEGAGLIAGGRVNPEARQGAASAAVTAHPERSELLVAWLGGACSHRPSLSVSGSRDALRLELRPAPAEWSLLPVQCPAVGLPFAVILELTVPVDQGSVTLVEVR